MVSINRKFVAPKAQRTAAGHQVAEAGDRDLVINARNGCPTSVNLLSQRLHHLASHSARGIGHLHPFQHDDLVSNVVADF